MTTLDPMPVESLLPRLEALLPQVRKPVQYVGGELNAQVKDWDSAAVRWCLMYPDAYEVGLPNQGVMILYEVLNEQPDVLAERTYSVWPDLEALMREHGDPAVHRRRAPPGQRVRRARRQLLDRARLHQLPRRARPRRASRSRRADRTDEHPIVIAGGHAAFNPEPIAEFLDAAVLGDGEQAVLGITDLVRDAKAEGWDRERRSSSSPGAGSPTCRASTTSTTCRRPHPPRRADPRRTCRAAPPSTPSWTSTRGRTRSSRWCRWPRSVHERMSVEIFRGCTRGCRFCQAGMITRPVRERSITGIGEMVERGLAATGYEEVGLLSAVVAPTTPRSARSPRGWPTATRARRPRCRCPSTRVDAFNIDLAERARPRRPALRADLRPRRRLASGCAR